ncbi:hypothetical protein CEP52_013872 [Fusarium oligoseptatum]|uniref:Zn(2)-C6 fungal-type domain-containing protein n=1 Tax=Fusarium oligoseptatum TaxID=2604345 RepID=A0A428SRG0_9HYPO|nr:hypothetical protein CEP52_013872 [Fusarium oligoseptatum]
MASRTGAPKKVRLACRRCRSRRIKCDGQVPACTNCAKAGQVCLDVDSQNSDIVIPRKKNIVRERAPDVDLRSGPQVEPAPDLGNRSVDEGGNEEGDMSTTPAATIPSPALQTRSRKRSAETSEQPDHDGSFPERAHSVAVNLGMLSLNSDSPQKHYLGSSSGLLFANLIGASPSSTGSTPQGIGDHVNTGDLEWQDSGVSAGQNRAYHQALHAFLKNELPTKPEALILAHTYLPPTMPSFRWNGRLIVPGVPGDHGATLPVIAFIIFMVFNIAAIVKVRTRIYEFPPQRFYKAAVHFSKDAFSQISLPTIQAMVMLINHSMLMPAEINLWTLVHLASAHCVELGIHREHHSERPEDFAMKQIRRFTFFTIYSLDRSISSIQGRPLGFRDETFDIGLPESPPPEDDDMNGAIPSSFMAAVTRYASYTYKLDRIISDIKLHLYHLPGDSSWFPWPENPVEHQQRIKQTLDSWWQEASRDEFDFPSLDNRQREVWKLKLSVKYHTATVLLFQPSQVVRNPSAQALQVCFDSSSSILEGYERLHDLHGLHHGWRAVQSIFAAGATLIYSFWTSMQVRKNASTAAMSKNLRTCSSLLTIGGEWWPSAKSGQRSFGSVADLTMRKLYMDDSSFKAPRLSLHSTSAGQSTRRLEGPEAEEDSITVLENPQTLDGINQLPLEETDGTWQGVTAASEHDQGMFHGIDMGRPDFVPEIEMFLADFDRSEFTWSFPLNGNEDLEPFGTHPNTGF